SSEKANERILVRKRQAYDFSQDKWNFTFKIKSKNKNDWELTDVIGCKASKVNDGWSLSTPLGDFKLVNSSAANISTVTQDVDDSNEWLNKLVGYLFLFAFIAIPFLYFMNLEAPLEEVKEELKKPITVKVIKQPDVVQVANNVSPQMKVKPLTKAEKAHRAVQRNLGFLGMVGSKDMKKVVGGVPQKLEKADRKSTRL